jgi:hypothetical protein
LSPEDGAGRRAEPLLGLDAGCGAEARGALADGRGVLGALIAGRETLLGALAAGRETLRGALAAGRETLLGALAAGRAAFLGALAAGRETVRGALADGPDTLPCGRVDGRGALRGVAVRCGGEVRGVTLARPVSLRTAGVRVAGARVAWSRRTVSCCARSVVTAGRRAPASRRAVAPSAAARSRLVCVTGRPSRSRKRIALSSEDSRLRTGVRDPSSPRNAARVSLAPRLSLERASGARSPPFATARSR